VSLEDIIYDSIPPAMLERVVYDQGILDEKTRNALFKASGIPPREIAKRTVAAYGATVAQLAFGLYEQVHETNWDAARRLFTHFQGRGVDYYNHQASLVGRIPTLPMEDLSDFLRTVKRKVCLIVSRTSKNGPVVRGTGFLVAPSLVLTCEHVLKDFTALEAFPDGSSIELYFDFFYGDPVEDVGPSPPGARRICLAKDWRREYRPHIRPDGLEGRLVPEVAKRIAESLDFVLLQLDQPVGLQPLSRGGGRRRGWIELPPDALPQGLQHQDWIIIPQHPLGFPQRIDLGRFKEPDQTETRIRYLTNTAKGTSGAPCFNHQFKLVGVHNAYVGPEEQPLANQAIRLDHIAQLVRPHIGNEEASAHALRWVTSRDGEDPKVVLGRATLLNWLKVSATASPARLAERVYAAEAKVQKSGCTFSVDVLHAEIRDSRTPRAVYGGSGQQLPETPEDFLGSLLRELGIRAENVEKIPARPAKDAAAPAPIPGEVDKPDRWLAEDLPDWLGRVITQHVGHEIDLRVVAKEVVESYRQRGLPPPPEDEAKAKADKPIIVRPNAWEFAYVVIDDLRVASYQGAGECTELNGDVLKLVAALVKSNDPAVRRLRWMFLGYLPDFLPVADNTRDGATFEPLLDPAAVGEQEVLEVFERMGQTHLLMDDIPAFAATASAKSYVQLTDAETSTEPRLPRLRAKVDVYVKGLLEGMGK
jgi:Trypsin-like peptidase domain